MPSGPVNARGERAKGECAIGAVTKGIKDGQEVSYYTWIQLNYEETFKKHGHSATAYSVGVPLATATMLYAQGNIRRKGPSRQRCSILDLGQRY
ncbi:MAG: hypothetical protein ACUVT7_07090 [Thermoplasmata archaeon]